MIPVCEVRVYPRQGWDLIDVWFISYDMMNRTGIVHYPTQDIHESKKTTFNEGDDLPAPSLTLPMRTMDALIKQAKGSFPPSEQMNNHLQDAIKVRDRLLTMVEQRGLH